MAEEAEAFVGYSSHMPTGLVEEKGAHVCPHNQTMLFFLRRQREWIGDGSD